MIFGAFGDCAFVRIMGEALASEGFSSRIACDDGAFRAGHARHPSLSQNASFAEAKDHTEPSGPDHLSIVADARIDARADLLARLGDPMLAENASDEALILAAYCRWGVRCPKHLIGDYAFAIHDTVRERLFCARDHIGARPFFYARIGRAFAFASDPAALLAIPGIDHALDERLVLTRLLHKQFDSFDRTFHRAIRKLAPGRSMSVECGAVSIDRYWQPGPVGIGYSGSPDDYARELRRLVECAVEDRQRDVDRLGLHLSGGLDSSAIAALAVPREKMTGRPDPVGFSWHRCDPMADPTAEPAWSQSVAKQFGIELVACPPDGDTIAEIVRRDWTRHPDPLNLINETPVQVAATRRGIDVILSGWGGDEAASFNGRGWQGDLLRRGRWPTMWKALHREHGRGASKRFLDTLLTVLRTYLRPRRESPQPSFASTDFRARVRPLPVPIVKTTGARRAMVDLYEQGGVTTRLETWYRSGARRGIDYRFPLLDRRVMEFAYSVPPDLFVREGTRRWLFRRAFDDVLPETVKRHAAKYEPIRMGELAPEMRRALGILRDELRTSRGKLARTEYIDLDALQRWLDEPDDMPQGKGAARVALQLLDLPERSC